MRPSKVDRLVKRHLDRKHVGHPVETCPLCQRGRLTIAEAISRIMLDKVAARTGFTQKYTGDQWKDVLSAPYNAACRNCSHRKTDHYSAGPTCMEPYCPCPGFILAERNSQS